MSDGILGKKERYIRELDSLHQTVKNAEEEYGQLLDEYEEEYGEQAREKYEEAHI